VLFSVEPESGMLNVWCQAVFGRLLNVPAVTVLKWEQGERKPSGAALRLLEIAKRAPEALMG
jgi:putative transcriptional regulator